MTATVYQIMLAPDRVHPLIAAVPLNRADMPAFCAPAADTAVPGWQEALSGRTATGDFALLPDGTGRSRRPLVPARTAAGIHPAITIALAAPLSPFRLKLRVMAGVQPLLPRAGGTRQVLRQARGLTWDMLAAYPMTRMDDPPNFAPEPERTPVSMDETGRF